MTDRTNRLALAAAEALHALAEALTDWAEDGLPDRYAANEELQRELEDAWQSRDWETVRRLQDEAEQREDAPEPDPLDEWRTGFHIAEGMTVSIIGADGITRVGTVGEMVEADGLTNWTLIPEAEEGGAADDAQEAILCPECGDHINTHNMEGCRFILCDCPRTPEDIARELITRAIKAEREADHD